jgi:hypothetical protein
MRSYRSTIGRKVLTKTSHTRNFARPLGGFSGGGHRVEVETKNV